MKRYFSIILTVVILLTTLNVYGEVLNQAIWQDPYNVMLVCCDKAEYKIYRADTIDGEYKYIGRTDTGSFRDDAVSYPDEYFYKLEECDASGNVISESAPIKAEVKPEALSKVSVIMYHNFITDEDIKAGVEFDEYSIKPEDFEADLRWLRDNGYVTITSDDLIKHLEGKKSLPHKSVIISIDDGSWGVYTNAFPLLKKYNMKADFNLIGANIDSTWESLASGGTRDGESAPYCTWEELARMHESGLVNLCSHSYGLHVYDRENRIGLSVMENETDEDYITAIKRDYELCVSCIEGWTGKTPETVAYPYSKRSADSDRLILENTGYKLLMAGDGARGTSANYFVKGADISSQYRLISRPCRMEGHPIGEYLQRIDRKDTQNGINTGVDYIKIKNSDEIAGDYQIFDDVKPEAWYSQSVYYSYLNGLMNGVGDKEFAPEARISRGMAATLLKRIAGGTAPTGDVTLSDTNGTEWWLESAEWAVENKILDVFSDGSFRGDEPISRELLAQAMYNCGKHIGLDMSATADITRFKDYAQISERNTPAVIWTVASGIFNGNADGTFNPSGNVTRAEMTMVLKNWLSKGE